jgi:molybdenum-dependent DNA-binding transcriptional regulator ModE
MVTLPKEKLTLLKKAFIEEAMSPGQAAKKVGVTYATANRYYEKWSKEIKEGLERRLIPQIEESIKQMGKKRKKSKRR